MSDYLTYKKVYTSLINDPDTKETENKTREEVAKDYVTKEELETSMDRLVRMLNKLESKLDKLFEVKQ